MNFIQSIDTEILMFIHNNFTSPLMDGFMTKITSIGNAGCVWIVIGLILNRELRNETFNCKGETLQF